ncbi:MAG: chlorophyll synthase ChlG [Burkholderiaceae bacterium]|nr:chlorophyll synthase ChlG [Burkholderiaceae bacterium]
MARIALPSVAVPPPAAILELLKPVTWFPPMWAFACGAVSSGVPLAERWDALVLGMLLAGPLLCGASQALNDWFDREVDAINEPWRPIPSGRVPGRWGLAVAIGVGALALAVAAALGIWVWWAAAVGLIAAWAYSAPPLRLKQNGWLGNAAVGFTYEGLAWLTGAIAIADGRLPPATVWAVAALYSVGAHGIMTLNDFKSMAGDTRLGVGSLPVRLGPQAAARVACVTMIVPQIAVTALLLALAQPLHALAVAALVLVQAALMRHFLRAPVARARWYSAVGVNFFVAGMLVAAFALRGGG